jgi:hypothetical protein
MGFSGSCCDFASYFGVEFLGHVDVNRRPGVGDGWRNFAGVRGTDIQVVHGANPS